MILPTASRLCLLSLTMATGLLACSREAPPSSMPTRDETMPEQQAVPVDQGSHDDTQAVPVHQGSAPTSTGDGACASDADCVPAQCCHATSCTLRASAPDCSDAMCTRDCRAGTLDCGGRCYCNRGECAAHIADVGNVGAAGS